MNDRSLSDALGINFAGGRNISILKFTMKRFKIRCQITLANDVSWISSVVFSTLDKNVGEPFLSGQTALFC